MELNVSTLIIDQETYKFLKLIIPILSQLVAVRAVAHTKTTKVVSDTD